MERLRIATGLYALVLLTIAAELRAQPPLPPDIEGEIIAPGMIFDEEGFDPQRPARYAEPPPLFDPGRPTWMPCQSLRVNRSLVLGHLWFGMDIMAWSTKGVHAPALLTTSPGGTDIADAGVLGQPGTRVLFGDEFVHNETRAGGKLTIGWWFDTDQHSGLEFHYFELDGRDIRFEAESPQGGFILARPVIDASTGDEVSVPLAFPGLQAGATRITSNLQLASTGIIYRKLFWASPFARLDYLVGYRHARLFDNLIAIEGFESLDDSSGFPAGTVVGRGDLFRAVNQFDGADLGIRGWWSRNGKLALTGIAKVAPGASNKAVTVFGGTLTGAGPPVPPATASDGGVLAQPSNIGRRAEQEFGVVSEVGIGLEWLPVCQLRISLGYTWLYWSDVARAMDQIDRTVDLDQLSPTDGPGGRPAFDFQTTSFWAQGLNAGFVYEF